jgi:predicted alpha/beta-fold hydrolase
MIPTLSSFTRRLFCRSLAAMAVLPLAARCGAITQTYPQRKIQTSILEVPGARLYYEIHGSGPLMLMVPGATGTADSFRRVTEHLVAHYTVVIYDRRGFSRSQLNGTQDYAYRLETDADDVRRLIEHVSDKPVTVLGSSSGGVMGKRLGRELIELPGGHIGHLTQPAAFAREFVQALAQAQRK